MMDPTLFYKASRKVSEAHQPIIPALLQLCDAGGPDMPTIHDEVIGFISFATMVMEPTQVTGIYVIDSI